MVDSADSLVLCLTPTYPRNLAACYNVLSSLTP